jgi:hypothetical protein
MILRHAMDESVDVDCNSLARTWRDNHLWMREFMLQVDRN